MYQNGLIRISLNADDISAVYLFVGSDKLPKLKDILLSKWDGCSHGVKLIASALGGMQCLLKGVCAACLQWQIDPETGERTKAVYGCSCRISLSYFGFGTLESKIKKKILDNIHAVWFSIIRRWT